MVWTRVVMGSVIALAAAAAAAVAADKPGQVERGRYLVENVGMCADCHTPRGAMGQADLQRPMAGAGIDFRPTVPMPAWADSAPGIAGPKARGWTKAQMVKFLETGTNPENRQPQPPMPAFRFNREDAEAVAAYLASLPAPVSPVPVKAGLR